MVKEIEIWQPRYKDDVVLLAKYKVKDHNYIKFTKAKHLEGMTFYVSRGEVEASPLETNGKIPCYAVPMNKLVQVEE